MSLALPEADFSVPVSLATVNGTIILRESRAAAERLE